MIENRFFAPACVLTAGEIAALSGAELADPSHTDIRITNIASADVAGEGDICFVEGRRHARLVGETQASAVLCTAELASQVRPGTAALISRRPQWSFAKVGRHLFPTAAFPSPVTGEVGVSPGAWVDPTANLEAGVIVEPGAIVGANAEIGSGTVVAPHAVIGPGVKIGRHCYCGPASFIQAAHIGNHVLLHGGVRIGQDGFGFVAGDHGAEKMPQIGRVIIQDHVEIGANTTIDRGALSDTVIGEGTKIDNLVQIAHNVRIGRHCLIASHSGISGSTVLDDGVLLGGRVGLADHLHIGAGVQLAASSGVMNDIPAGEKWMGTPAMPIRDFFRSISAMRRLGERKRGSATNE